MLPSRLKRIRTATSKAKDSSRLARTMKMLMKPANVTEISAVVSSDEKTFTSAA